MVMAPGQGTGFVSVGDYLDANQGTIGNEVGQITSGIGNEVAGAKSAADAVIGSDKQNYQQDYTGLPGYGDALDKAIKAKTDATALGSEGGLSDYFQKHMGDTSAQGDFDAGLLGGNSKIREASQSGNGLEAYLNGGLAGVQPPSAPTGPYRTDPGAPAPGGPGPGGGDERNKDKPGSTPWPWTYQPDPGTPTPKGRGGK